MPSILNDEEKQTVKRTVPKSSNKIQAVAVGKLYVALPPRQPTRWQYTGLQGALVLADDLVGHTFWLKLVDISPSNRGVIWDMEIYEGFQYFQDRTFFHSFEGEKCMFGVSFADEKEARQMRKKMDEREKNASKATKAKPFSQAAGQNQQAVSADGGGGKHHRFGGLFSKDKGSAQQSAPQSIIPPKGVEVNSAPLAPSSTRSSASASGIDLTDPAVQAVLKDLVQMGITEDQIEEHAGFIKSYLEQNKATAAAEAEKRGKAPPPPPPGPGLSPQNTGGSGRGPAPPPPPSRRAAPGGFAGAVSAIQKQQELLDAASPPSPSAPRDQSPPRARFRAPPPLADAGKFANEPPASRNRATSQSAGVPPPPPRPAKTPLDDETPSPQQSSPPSSSAGRAHAVPPPFTGNRLPSGGPPPPPARNNAAPAAVPPPPPPRDSASSGPPLPPPRSSQTDSGPPIAPPLPPSSARPVPPPPTSFSNDSGPPPPPPLPPPNASSSAPPPPPLPPPNASSGPPPPPPMPPRNAGNDDTPSRPPPSSGGRDGLLADIRGGARLKKVSDSEKRDRSAAAVPGAEPAAPPPPSSAGGAGAAEGGLAGALASALAARKSKVSHSDDEHDDDDW